MTEHTGWDRGDYDMGESEDFQEMAPKPRDEWQRELKRAIKKYRRLQKTKRNRQLRRHEDDRLALLELRIEVIRDHLAGRQPKRIELCEETRQKIKETIASHRKQRSTIQKMADGFMTASTFIGNKIERLWRWSCSF